MAGQASGAVYTYLDADAVDEDASGGASYFLDVSLTDGEMQRVGLGQAAADKHHLFLPLLTLPTDPQVEQTELEPESALDDKVRIDLPPLNQ